MDTTDIEIFFDDEGICNHCKRFDLEFPKRVYKGLKGQRKLEELISSIKNHSGTKYDCIIGVSGGVDSSYVALLVKKYGLNPLAIHLDNGWNSKLAIENIEKLIEKLNIDLYTYVINWREFRELQLSFFQASVPDVEVVTDHAINAVLFNMAQKFKIKYIISGMNFSTESLSVPTWSYGHSDYRYIQNVNKRFNNTKIKTYPHFTLFDLFKWTFINKIKVVSILNYIEYDKESAKRKLNAKLGWKPYTGKHHESIFTKFFQEYYLPKKFNIDKRKGHLSDLIRTNQISRNEALKILKETTFDSAKIETDINYVLKKINVDRFTFQKILSQPNKTFRDYKNQYNKIQYIKLFVNQLRKFGLYSK